MRILAITTAVVTIVATAAVAYRHAGWVAAGAVWVYGVGQVFARLR